VTAANRGKWIPWASLGLVALLCAVLAVLQYCWIGEVSNAERSHLRNEVQSRLTDLSAAFNREIYRALEDAQPGQPSPAFRNISIEKLTGTRQAAPSNLAPETIEEPRLERFLDDREGGPAVLHAELDLNWVQSADSPTAAPFSELSRPYRL